jgi:hypothetical protein
VYLISCSLGFTIEIAKMPPIFLEKTRASQYEFQHDLIHLIDFATSVFFLLKKKHVKV